MREWARRQWAAEEEDEGERQSAMGRGNDFHSSVRL